MMPRTTCSMCVCVLQTFHAAQRFFIFHELLVSAGEVCAHLTTKTWVPVACHSITLKLSITSANLKDQQRLKKCMKVRTWKTMKVQNNGSNGAILFSSDPTAFSLHSAESLVALQSSTPTPKLGTTNGAYKRHKIRSGAVRSSRLHIHIRRWQQCVQELRMGPYSARMSMASWACEPPQFS